MIKLIATDIDGTLVKDSSPVLYPELVETVAALLEKGIIFCGASGRQYYSIYRLFGELADRIVYIAENGAYIRSGSQNLQVTAMRPEHVKTLITQLRQYDDTCEILVSTLDGSLFESKKQDFYNLMHYQYRNKFRQVDDLLAIEGPILKVSIYRKEGLLELGEKTLIPAWKDTLKACMAGKEWVDFMDASVDKGNGLAFLMQHFGVSKEETMAFGDNENDIGMMRAAGESYAVENAVEEVKKAARHLCPDYTKHGVCDVLQALLRTM